MISVNPSESQIEKIRTAIVLTVVVSPDPAHVRKQLFQLAREVKTIIGFDIPIDNGCKSVVVEWQSQSGKQRYLDEFREVVERFHQLRRVVSWLEQTSGETVFRLTRTCSAVSAFPLNRCRSRFACDETEHRVDLAGRSSVQMLCLEETMPCRSGD